MSASHRKTSPRVLFAVLGLSHAAIMSWFLMAPELGPLVVYQVDYPVVLLLKSLGLPSMPALVSAMVVCSFLYPALLLGAIGLLKGLVRRLSTQL